MNELTLHPNVYATSGSRGLVHLLERVWVREHEPGQGTMFIVSGFGNYNGGVRFYETFRHHTQQGGRLIAVFAGSTSARLTSRQVVRELLECGAEVHVVNRKRLMHAKCYGTKHDDGESLIVTSGNFTGPGMSQNVEMAVLLEPDSTAEMGFSWDSMLEGMLSQRWNYHRPALTEPSGPEWQLLYDEFAADIVLDDTDEVTMVLRLGHSDTVRINAAPGTTESEGTQYFWLSKDCYDFFPPLTIRNARGHKATYSCLVSMNYVDLDVMDRECRVTFEAENNRDFRLGTGPLRYRQVVDDGDYAAITRLGEARYDMRFFRAGSPEYLALQPYVVNLIGHKGKAYGFIPNTDFIRHVGLPAEAIARAR